MVLELFSSIRYLIKADEITIDNWIFKLHYRMTVVVNLTILHPPLDRKILGSNPAGVHDFGDFKHYNAFIRI
jgi:hypothetical protein